MYNSYSGADSSVVSFFLVSPAFACGVMPAGQERRVAFNVRGFTLPVRMAWTSDACSSSTEC
ncbi:hypothetical protein KIN20_013655 [Parelaphostrongylus tenuis]|uniref:Uncharacterized protein n=1 Tax=Parelaphostrongylus tenuis TaxID=148309 RepID=A0AAD5QL64_PARTN|nr:hypothetical protein KIN20_013655 [Parelaphostrongylus tenuis]